jgi:hypothetical protein
MCVTVKLAIVCKIGCEYICKFFGNADARSQKPDARCQMPDARCQFEPQNFREKRYIAEYSWYFKFKSDSDFNAI